MKKIICLLVLSFVLLGCKEEIVEVENIHLNSFAIENGQHYNIGDIFVLDDIEISVVGVNMNEDNRYEIEMDSSKVDPKLDIFKNDYSIYLACDNIVDKNSFHYYHYENDEVYVRSRDGDIKYFNQILIEYNRDVNRDLIIIHILD